MKNFFRYHLFDKLRMAKPRPDYVPHAVNSNGTGYCIATNNALSQIFNTKY